MEMMSNEQLCILAQHGDVAAQNLLIENNLPYIKKTAYELWNTQAELNRSLGIMQEDLIQEGSIGLYHCIESYQPDSGNKFLTYASPAIYNAMVDYIRKQNISFESRYLNEIVRLDDITQDENRRKREFIADSNQRNPEQIYLEKERHEEIHLALNRIDLRERTYLWFRFGFEDDIEHPLTETAKHFHLSESRTRLTEKAALDNVRLELP
uniref:sigma-70 family RNA polymerase sigma factor n=1 Tax=Agathobacter sp. TaxID=2021311 RepID=UPI00405617CC